MITVVVVQDQHRVPRITGKLCTTENLLVHLLVQTKFTVQELSISGKHDLSARTLVPVWVKGRPIAPLFPADLTPRCGGFRFLLEAAKKRSS